MMKATRTHVMVLVTVPDRKVGRALAAAALDARACACAQIVPGLESHYVWQGRRERGSELLVVLKTTRARLRDLEAVIRSVHPYTVPQIVTVPLTAGGADYLAWVDAAVARPSVRGRARGSRPEVRKGSDADGFPSGDGRGSLPGR